MPELPEVETVRRGLERVLVGEKVASVTVTGTRSVRRQSIAAFEASLVGRVMTGVGRRGKYLLCALDDGAALVIHLRMSGKLCLAERNVRNEPHTHIVIGLEGKGELRFVDPRTFGEMFVTSNFAREGVPTGLDSLGIDPLTDGIDKGVIHDLVARRRTSLKAFLLDQRAVAGIGSIYADEICFLSGLRPDKKTETLDEDACERLGVTIVTVLEKAVELGGSSLRDESYRDLFGKLGSYQNHHFAYGRTGKPCRKCSTPIESIRVAGRSAHFCPHCQS